VVDRLLEGLLLGASAAAQPGPFQAYLLDQTVTRGARRTLPAALAPLLSDAPIVALVLGVLHHTPAWALRALGVGGGVYLLLLAVRAARGSRAPDEPAGVGRGLLRASLVNLLAPGPYLFWGLVAGPIVIGEAARSWAAAAAFVVGFYTALIGGNALWIGGVGAAGALGERPRAVLRWLSVVALGGFGAWSLWRGLIAG
jgi:threonine/homoserine/homoserine lactone efflux protein